MKDIIIDTLLDTIKLIPFLLIAFIIIEYIEHKLSNKSKNIISKSNKLGPILGSILGIIPQCGFSVIATNLYFTRIISLGTLIAIYLSTSDEMLPILISEKVDIKLILLILSIKLIVGIIFGYLIDLIFRNKKKETTYDICEKEHCHCDETGNIFKSAIIHTIHTLIYLLIIIFILNILFSYLDSYLISKIFLKDSYFGPFITSLIGLIPNCGSSIALTELFIKDAISFADMIAGLLTNSGVAILVLFRNNKNIKENLTIISITYIIGVLVGLIIKIFI